LLKSAVHDFLFFIFCLASQNSPSPTNGVCSPNYTILSPRQQYGTQSAHTADAYQTETVAPPPQAYPSTSHQVYHSSATPAAQQLYTNVLNAPTALSYPTPSWHNGTGADYGLYQNATYTYQTEYIPLVSDIG